jgi:hypothetical protein
MKISIIVIICAMIPYLKFSVLHQKKRKVIMAVIRSLPHGHVAAILETIKKLGLDKKQLRRN